MSHSLHSEDSSQPMRVPVRLVARALPQISAGGLQRSLLDSSSPRCSPVRNTHALSTLVGTVRSTLWPERLLVGSLGTGCEGPNEKAFVESRLQIGVCCPLSRRWGVASFPLRTRCLPPGVPDPCETRTRSSAVMHVTPELEVLGSNPDGVKGRNAVS